MQNELVATLQKLGMPNARIELEISQRSTPDITGADKVVF